MLSKLCLFWLLVVPAGYDFSLKGTMNLASSYSLRYNNLFRCCRNILPLLICILTAGCLSLENHAEQMETVSAPLKPRCVGFLNSPYLLPLRDVVDPF